MTSPTSALRADCHCISMHPTRMQLPMAMLMLLLVIQIWESGVGSRLQCQCQLQEQQDEFLEGHEADHAGSSSSQPQLQLRPLI